MNQTNGQFGARDAADSESACDVAAAVDSPCAQPASMAESQHSFLAAHILAGSKPVAAWRCGLELELFGYEAQSLNRLRPQQVAQVLRLYGEQADAQFTYEALETEVKLPGGARLTVEPGGQIEFSTAPRANLIELDQDVNRHLARLAEIGSRLGYMFTAIGFDPLHTIDAQHWYPKQRYKLMRPYLEVRGAGSLDMMARTCATQVNMDFSSEADLLKKFKLAFLAAPIATAMFADSPFRDGKPSGYKSSRYAAWLMTDPQRTGLAPHALERGYSLEGFVQSTLQAPIIFLRRGGDYVDTLAGLPFSSHLKLSSLDQETLLADWLEHLSTIFTDARLKQFIELRSADSCSAELSLALQAFWKGLLYDADSLAAAGELLSGISAVDIEAARIDSARHGLSGRYGRYKLLDVAKELVLLADAGLAHIADCELHYLAVLKQMVIEDELCPADILLRNWNGAWHGSIARVLDHCRIDGSDSTNT